jgi:tetratricopeptide (TPR) repeat protein
VILGRELMNSQRSARTNAEAIALLEKALRLEPAHFLANTIFARATADHVLNGWAPREGRAERLERAEAAVQRALKRHPTSAGAHLTRGALLRARGEHELAVEVFREALEHNPRFANAYAELGRTLTELGRPREAIAEIEKADALNETDFARYVWFYWAGLAAIHAGDPETALHWLRRSHNVNAAYDNTYRLMAVALADTQRWEEARKKVAEFLSLRPDATADDWKRPGVRNRPEAMKVRKHIRETLVRLGLPEGEVKAAATPPAADAPDAVPRQ